MSDFPSFEPGASEACGIGGSTTYGAVLPRGAAANFKGAWVPLVTTTHAIRRLDLTISKYAITGTLNPIRFLLDLGIGTRVLVNNIYVAMNPRSHARSISLPLNIPAGVTLNARMAAGTHGISGPSLYVSGTAYSQGFANLPAFRAAAAYGAVTSTTSGTLIDPGPTADTKGAWVQITAATAARHRLWLFSIASQILVAPDGDFRIDIGVGPAAGETVFIADLVARITAGSDDIGPNMWTLPVVVAAGSRLAVRAQSTITAAAQRTFSCDLIGFD